MFRNKAVWIIVITCGCPGLRHSILPAMGNCQCTYVSQGHNEAKYSLLPEETPLCKHSGTGNTALPLAAIVSSEGWWFCYSRNTESFFNVAIPTVGIFCQQSALVRHLVYSWYKKWHLLYLALMSAHFISSSTGFDC